MVFIKNNNEKIDAIRYFYHHLRDNYIAQKNSASANTVEYDLATKEQNYLNGFDGLMHKIYGITFGWGYKPMRFMITCFVFVSVFALIFYLFFYHRIAILLDKKLTTEDIEILGKGAGAKKILYFKCYDHLKYSNKIFNLLMRIWHTIYFSTSVLVSLRFKKEWITKEDNLFFYWVIAEWFIGIVLYIVFMYNVESSQFDNIKDLLQL